MAFGMDCGMDLLPPFSFFGSIFSNDIALYGVNNNGAWYDFGFVMGAGISFGGIFRRS
jgi:hypothetical protein